MRQPAGPRFLPVDEPAMVRDPATTPAWHARLLEAAEGKTGPRRLFVLLHGWGLTGESLMPLARQLQAHGACWVPDLPGFGKTPMLREGAGSAEYAEALLRQPAIVEARMAGRPIVLIGHSFGARLALRAAAADPRTVSCLVLIAGAGLKRRRGPGFRARAAMLKAVGRLLRRIDHLAGTTLFAHYASRVGSADYRRAGPLRSTLVAVVNEDLGPVAARIRQPVLLLYGREDTETPPELGERFAALMPDAELVILDGLGHLDILGAGAFQCAHRILSFLQRKAPAPADDGPERGRSRC
ncbi:MAG: alpha/beta fold hydrolase [Alphaproteobacteria bacterium]|nr:MAG: alpha/beta fold hydrolase [Alphaproteobacteria bacterium]